jgi:uncharacterized phage protein (TIGR01671 family)
MQRQIKFRIYNKRLNRFVFRVEIGEIKAPPNNGLLGAIFDSDEEDKNAFKAEECVIQQFTGLCDANNKEIYEGDIVKTDPEHIAAKLQTRRESEEYTEYTKGQVRWWNEGFAVCQEYIGAVRISEYSSCDCCPCGLEIIGNIFENPELLSTV